MMNNNNYYKAYVEVLEILNYIPIEKKNKLPSDIIETLEKKSDQNYSFKLDFNIPFENQNLLKETKSILAVFYRDYWADASKRKEIIIKERQEMANEKFDYDELFRNRKKDINKTEEVVVYEDNKKWYKSFLEFFKKFFKRK